MSPPDLQVSPDELRQGARILESLEQDAGNIRALASDANPDAGTWGLVGVPFAIWYNNTADDIHENLGLITECLGTKAVGLTATADEYEALDGGISDSLTEIDGLIGDISTSGIGFGAGPVDVVRLDPAKDLPLAGQVGQIGQFGQGVKNLAAGDGDWTELTGIMDEAVSLGLTGAAAAADPFHFLISNGLGFLIDLIQPLEDALGWVTGNPERMEGEILRWERVGQSQAPLAEAVLAVSENGLATWQGLVADAARQRFGSFAGGIAGTGDDIQKVVYILRIAQTTMTLAQAFVIGLIATFVEWLVFTWVPALASAPVTFGGSTAAASAATTGKFAQVMMRLKNFLTRVIMILRKVRGVLTRLFRSRMKRVQVSFQLRDKGRFATGWIGSREAVARSLTNWRTYYNMGIQLGASGLDHSDQAVRDGDGLVPDSHADERADQLDPDR
jgi:hypothetical protein